MRSSNFLLLIATDRNSYRDTAKVHRVAISVLNHISIVERNIGVISRLIPKWYSRFPEQTFHFHSRLPNAPHTPQNLRSRAH